MAIDPGAGAFPGERGGPGVLQRDYVAIMAMQGIIAAGRREAEDGIAELAYEIADAMIAHSKSKRPRDSA